MIRADGLASITVVIPTMNRPTLARTVQSAAGADEIVVVGDGVLPATGDVRLQESPRSTDRGSRAAELRNAGMRQATGDWIAFMDDDDVFTPRAVDTIRAIVSGQQPALYVFRMLNPGGVLWRHPVIEYCNVGTPMIVCPSRDYKPWPVGGSYPAEDYGFAHANQTAWPGGVVFRAEVIAHVRPT